MSEPSVTLLQARITELEKQLEAAKAERDCAVRTLADFAHVIGDPPPPGPPRRLQIVGEHERSAVPRGAEPGPSGRPRSV